MKHEVDPKKLVMYLGKRKPKSVDDIVEHLGCFRSQVVRTLHFGKKAGCLVQEGDMWAVRKRVSQKRLQKFIETKPKTIRDDGLKGLSRKQHNPKERVQNQTTLKSSSEDNSTFSDGQFNYGRKKSTEWNDTTALSLSDRLTEQKRRIDEGLL